MVPYVIGELFGCDVVRNEDEVNEKATDDLDNFDHIGEQETENGHTEMVLLIRK